MEGFEELFIGKEISWFSDDWFKLVKVNDLHGSTYFKVAIEYFIIE
jgi:hypothetical protein